MGEIAHQICTSCHSGATKRSSERMNWWCAALLFFHAQFALSDNVGWKAFFTENIEEFHDIPLKWEQETPIPAFVTGTFVRNGAARISFGSPRRILSSWLEGYAKIHTFKFNGSRVLFSGKMLETPKYLENVKKGELVPQLTFNYFENPADEWTWYEKISILGMMAKGNAYDNSNPAVWRMGPQDKRKGVYMAVTDDPVSTQFDIKTLKTIQILSPKMLPPTVSGCTHWMREPGTDNSININTRIGITGPRLEVYRWRPEHTYQEPELVAKIAPKKMGYFHSFSITENYAVLFLYPVTFEMNFWKINFHLMEGLTHDVTGTTDIYLINLKTGEVTSRSTHYIYSLHHANAYEAKDEIIVDLVSNRFEAMRDYMKLKDMLNPPAVRNFSESNSEDLYRFHIGIQKDYVRVKTFKDDKSLDLHRFTNHFEFPTINEDYRGKKYCVLYGWSAYQVSRQTLVKRNLCNDSLSKTWSPDDNFNHYSGEMSFVANPNAKSEDDGILITNVFDGNVEKSYLLVLDAKTFKPINKAWLPHAIPMSFHGMYFPEAQF